MPSRFPPWHPAPPPRPNDPRKSEKVASAANRWLKLFRAALRGAGTTENGLVAVEGRRLIEDALDSRAHVLALLFSPSGEGYVRAGVERIPADCRLLETTERLFAGVTGTETPQGVAALFRLPIWRFEDLTGGAAPLVVVLAGVQDPGNVGAAIRSAEAFGASGVIATRGTSHPYSPKALRASAGSALRLPVWAGIAAPVVLAQLRVAGLKVFAATVRADGPENLLAPSQVDLRGRVAFLIGNEGAGLPAEIERAADARIRIPVSGINSLNAGVAASVLLYEAARQRAYRG